MRKLMTLILVLSMTGFLGSAAVSFTEEETKIVKEAQQEKTKAIEENVKLENEKAALAHRNGSKISTPSLGHLMEGEIF